MTYQPDDNIFHYAYNDNEFNDLDAGLSLRSTSQVTNNEHNIDVDNYLQRLLDELLTTSNVDEVSDKNYDSGAASLLTPSYYLDEPLFPDCQLEDICGDPINEVAITTTTTNTENNNNNYMVNNASSELNSNEYENRTSDEIKNLIKQSFDDFNLQFIDNSIEQRTMLIETPPPAKFRYRYKSDTKHYIEKSRTKPMVIKLPDLKGIKLNSNQLFWLRLILTTYSENPLDEVYLHVNQLKYHSNDIHELDDKTICIPLTLTDIEEGKKALSCLSIIKTTLNNYMSRLIPFNLTRINNESYENTNEKISIPEAKKIFKKFNLKASRIVCQLVIKQNEFWHFTNITCQTKGIEDKEQKNTTKKRSAETNDSDEDERPTILLAVGLNDDNPNDFLSSLLSISNDDTYPETTNGNTSSELFRFSSDEQRDNRAIIDDRQMIPNPTLDQNLDIINMPMFQQIIENSNALMYQMNPFIFEIIDSVMFVKQQPKANNRIRYECDGSRFLPDSRHHPMSINLPNLQHILSAKNQTLGIIMTIVTSTDNPNNQTFVHANDIIYREADMIKIAYGCIFIPLRQSDINNGEKEFRRLSILYKKYNDYTFDLTPFNTNTMFGTTEKYTILNDHNMEKVPKVKCFKKNYDLLSYKLVFQLALKEDNMIFISNITCETEIVHEQIMTQKSSKRTASCSTESLSEEESNFEMQISNSSKRFKSSTPPLIGLPVIRVSNQCINSDMDHQQ
ncbi:unnamed protein product [Rotaria sordida]|uniref:Uncharacterized protein n=1 Tax=Rotaria sordida TaxID=392033 RepID=A0A814UZW4_9BILA|nr:unnamed protein product [Rotaria sordida]